MKAKTRCADRVIVSKRRRPASVEVAEIPVAAVPSPVACPHCAHLCTVIRLTPTGDERSLTLHSCHFCEHRWWTRGDDSVTLRDVLTATKVEKKTA